MAGLIGYLDSIVARDPAPRSRWEVLLYPGLWAVGFHRVAYALFNARLFFLARLVNHFSRFLTAIDYSEGLPAAASREVLPPQAAKQTTRRSA